MSTITISSRAAKLSRNARYTNCTHPALGDSDPCASYGSLNRSRSRRSHLRTEQGTQHKMKDIRMICPRCEISPLHTAGRQESRGIDPHAPPRARPCICRELASDTSIAHARTLPQKKRRRSLRRPAASPRPDDSPSSADEEPARPAGNGVPPSSLHRGHLR